MAGTRSPELDASSSFGRAAAELSLSGGRKSGSEVRDSMSTRLLPLSVEYSTFARHDVASIGFESFRWRQGEWIRPSMRGGSLSSTRLGKLEVR